MCEQAGDRRGVAWSLESLAVANAAQQRSVRAAKLWGASDQLLESVGAFLPPQFKLVRERYFNAVKGAVGDSAFQAAFYDGRAMSLTQAVEYALAEAALTS